MKVRVAIAITVLFEAEDMDDCIAELEERLSAGGFKFYKPFEEGGQIVLIAEGDK